MCEIYTQSALLRQSTLLRWVELWVFAIELPRHTHVAIVRLPLGGAQQAWLWEGSPVWYSSFAGHF